MFQWISLQADTLSNQTANAVITSTVQSNNITALGFLLKGGFFLIPIGILLFYTFYIIIERCLYIHKKTQNDPNLMPDIRNYLQSGNLDMARTLAERTPSASGAILREGILTIGRPIAEIESNMERATNIEIGEMEKNVGKLGLIAGIAPTLGFIGTISGVIKIFYTISLTENISIGSISGGLYEKMISSGSGLIVGIIAYSGYHLLNNGIDAFALQVQKQVLEFVNIIQRPSKNDQKK
ncbi:MotA/TolQ/ExbB proton channel family protein [Flavobacterium branchiophilum]|uniref:Biopolymer transporter ExbB n=1 Tax=Flavobacterium branchiophilum TaxID=55197 RepID=A0A2H3KPG9_9FLAO|nr:MotA/TolQ/ExbB proton channel family protein [Flavobacterium branchiophilum]PDS23129.1 biopolymer transporter ExbB [Flavobacterium branchiophilum]